MPLPKERKIRVTVDAPDSGLNYSRPSTMIDDKQSPEASGIRYKRGKLQKMPGHIEFADTDGSPLDGIFMLAYLQGTTLICHTTTKMYRLSGSTFTDITGTAFTGSADNFYSRVWMNSLYITSNGADLIRKWNLSSATELVLTTPDPYLVGWINTFGSRLCLYHTTESGTDRKLRCRWSVVGDPEDWAAVGSGFADLEDSLGDSDTIQRAERLGAYMVVYGDNSMCLQQYTQDPYSPFAFSSRVAANGLAAPRALVNLQGKAHIFLGLDNVYRYTGGVGVEPIGDPIRTELFEALNQDLYQRSFFVHIPEERVLRLHFPRVGDTYCGAFFEYNLESGSWARGIRTYSGFGRGRSSCDVTWCDWFALGITWADLTGVTWRDVALRSGFPFTLYGDGDGKVYEDDGTAVSLLSTAIDGRHDTKDFTTGPGYRRTTTAWMGLNFEGMGNNVDVYYSADGGESYVLLKSVTLDGYWKVYNVHFEIYSTRIRFRFRHTSANGTFAIRWYEVEALSESEIGVEHD